MSLHSKVEAMATTMTNQQKVLEINERANRAKNIVIVGVQEVQEEQEVGNTVQHLFKDRLDLHNIAIASARRLGKARLAAPKFHPSPPRVQRREAKGNAKKGEAVWNENFHQQRYDPGSTRSRKETT